MKANNSTIHALLGESLAAHRKGDLEGAEKACRKVLKMAPREFNALQIMGLIQAARGNDAKALSLMKRSLRIAPDQPNVLNNIGRLLAKKGERTAAIKYYRRALALKADYFDCWLNLAMTLADDGQTAEAREAATHAARLAANDPRPHNLLGLIEKDSGHYNLALRRFDAALAAVPTYFLALHNRALTLKLAERLDEAIDGYRTALAIRDDVPELHYNLANALYESGAFQAALDHYRRAIALRPDYPDAHKTLNRLLWEHEHKDSYLLSYREAITRAPQSGGLRLLYAEGLGKLGRHDEAEDVLNSALREIGPQAAIFHGLGHVTGAQGRDDEAIAAFEKAIRLDRHHPAYRGSIARQWLRMEEAEKALVHLEQAEKTTPFDQEVIAYKGLCWLLLDDPREVWLNNYERFVRTYRIETPPSYKSLGDFNRALNRALDPLHRTETHPADQTLRGGTQTHGSLFSKPIPEVQAVRRSIEKALGRYIDDMDDDGDHPLLCRKAGGFRFAGSWSVRLRNQGFHVNHVHSAGWISSSYYVDLPDVVSGSAAHEGWITFGESGLRLGGRDRVRKVIEPEPGLLALFPSYIFHGTVPFSSTGTRTTTPFDAVPL